MVIKVLTPLLLRRVGIPATILLALTLAFDRALPPSALVLAALAVTVTAAATAATRLRFGPKAAVAGFVVAVTASCTALLGRLSPGAVGSAFTTFLVVGLPAGGLTDLRVIPYVVIVPAVTAVVLAADGDRPWWSLVVVAASVVAATLLVAPVGMSWPVGPLLALAVAVLLATTRRDDLVSIPPLVGSHTELRRRFVWWRGLGQLLPALGVAALAVLVPMPQPFDVRNHISAGHQIDSDPNPLALTARMRVTNSTAPAAEVSVDGTNPGRLRLAVLDRYEPTGWFQDAEAWVTGGSLAADPLQPGSDDATTQVEVTAKGIEPLFRAVPSAGIPTSVQDPGGISYDAHRSLIYAEDRTAAVTYRSRPGNTDRSSVGGLTPTDVPGHLMECPDSEVIRSVADQLASGAATPLDRLRRIEAWLIRTQIYDEEAPGGQTLGAVERFLSQPYARGNLEVFVTSFALLSRCASVPARVVVGFEAPFEEPQTYAMGELVAWVETPLDDVGWVPFDPLPSPEEQELQAQIITEEPDPPPPPEPPIPPATQVEPITPDEPERRWWPIPVAVGATLLVVAGGFLLIDALTRRRRRRAAVPAQAVLAAWDVVHARMATASSDLGPHQTPTDVVRSVQGRAPAGAVRLTRPLIAVIDRARYAPDLSTPADADLAWGTVDAVNELWPVPRRRRLLVVLRPLTTVRNARKVRSVPTGKTRWGAPVEPLVHGPVGPPDDVPGVDLSGLLGEGSTGTVYRGLHRESGRAVAVKVFRLGPGDSGFDQARFDWECAIAREVSGRHHFPEVLDTGVTEDSVRPYLVSTLYEDGSLQDRLARDGSLSFDESLLLARDITIALGDLHHLGVVHADVKPENIFASDRGWVLGDLGSAWTMRSNQLERAITPPYAAPEVWRGGNPTPVADLYGMALTTYCAAIGSPPIAGQTPDPAHVSTVFATHPVLASCLDPDPRQRPANADLVLQELQPQRSGSTRGGVPTITLPGATRPTH